MRFAAVIAIFFALTFALQPAHATIVETMPGGPGDWRAHALDVATKMQTARDRDYDDNSTAAALDALDRYQAAGFSTDDQMQQALTILKDPVKRQGIGALLRLYEKDPTLRELQTIQDRVETNFLKEAAKLEPDGVQEAPLMMLDRVMGKLNFSQPEHLQEQWEALPDNERALAVIFFVEVSDQWSKTSDSPMAKAYGDISKELHQFDPLDIADGKVDTPVMRERMKDVVGQFQDLAMRNTDPALFGVDPANRTLDEPHMSELLVKYRDMVLEATANDTQQQMAATVAPTVPTLGPMQAAGQSMKTYDSGLSINGDGGTGTDGNLSNPTEIGPMPAHDSGATFTGVLQKGDNEDAYYMPLPRKAGIWSIYLATPVPYASMAMSVRYVDGIGNVDQRSAPWVTYGDVATGMSLAGFGGGRWTRVTLQVPDDADHWIRVAVRLPDGSNATQDLNYQLTFERYDHDEGAYWGISKVDFQDPATYGPSQPNPVIFSHGLFSGADMWHAPSPATTMFDSIRGPPLIAALVVLSLVIFIQFWLVVVDLIRVIAFAPLIIGAIAMVLLALHVIDLMFTLVQWGNVFIGFARTHSTRQGGGPSMWDAVKGQGFFVGTWEYHQRPWLGPLGADLAQAGSIQDAGYDLRQGVNVIQQAYWNYMQARDGAAFSLQHPDDIKVSLVGHSMGGMVSRFYTDTSDYRQVGAMTLPIFENDADRVVQIATPNGGSTPGQWLKKLAFEKFGLPNCSAAGIAKDVFMEFVKKALSVSATVIVGVLAIIGPSGLFYSFFINVTISISVNLRELTKILVWKIITCGTLIAVEQLTISDLMPDSPPVKWLDSHNNQAVPKAQIYGVPWDTWNDEIKFLGIKIGGEGDWKLLDGIVSEHDAVPDSYRGSTATATNYDLHVTMVSDAVVQGQTIAYLSAAPGQSLKGVHDEPIVWGRDPLTVSDWVLVYWNVCHNKIVSIGGLFLKIWKFFGADGAPSTADAEQIDDLTRTGNPAAAQSRLAHMKGLQPGPYALIGPGINVNNVVNATVIDPSRDDDITQIAQRAPDVAILDHGETPVAEQWLEIAGEPRTKRATDDTPDSIRTNRVLVVPQGGLEGLSDDASFARLVDAHLARGGTVVALAQHAGADWSALPGGLRGYGTRESAATKDGDVVLSAIAPETVGQRNATPAMTSDGFFTAWPANATVLLRENATGEPVLVKYPWGNGTIVAMQLTPLVPDSQRSMTTDERLLMRDIMNAERAVAPSVEVAPLANVTIDLPIANPTQSDVASVTLTLVDPFLIADARYDANVTIPAGGHATLTVTFPASIARGIWSVDARLRDANGTALGDEYNVARYTVSKFAGDAHAIAYRAAPLALSVTSDRAAVLTGEGANLTAHVFNHADTPANATLLWWFPDTAARTLDPQYGGGPDGAGYALSTTVAVPAGGAIDVAIPVNGLLANDSLQARLVADGATQAEATFPLAVYDPSTEISVGTASPAVAPDGTLVVNVTVRDISSDAAASPGVVRVLIENATGSPMLTRDQDLVLAAAPSTATFSLALPSLPPGAYAIRAQALVDGIARGRGTGAFEVSARSFDAAWTLPASFSAGTPSTATLTLTHEGTLPIASGLVRATLTDPSGAIEWNTSQAFTLAPGATLPIAFGVAPTNAAPGVHRLVATVTTEDGTRAIGADVISRLTVRLVRHPGLFVAHTDTAMSFNVTNAGLFVEDGAFAVEAPSLGFATNAPITLAPASSTIVSATVHTPGDVVAGAHTFNATIDGRPAANMTFLVVPARVGLDAPSSRTYASGATIPLSVTNDGGVDASVSASAALADAAGHVVARSELAPTIVQPFQSASFDLAIPADVATGAYRLSVVVGPPGLDGSGTLRRTYDITGVSATLSIAPATQTADVNATALVHASVGVTQGALSSATLRLRAVDPVPLSRVDRLADGVDVTAIAAGDAIWAVERGQVLARLDGDALTPIALPSGLNITRIDALAASGARAAIATDAGVLLWDGAAWSLLDGSPPLVRALTFDEDGALVAGANEGLWRHAAGAWTSLDTRSPGTAVTALATAPGSVWAGLGDLRPRLLPTLDLSRRVGTLNGESAIVVDRLGRTHVLYADGPAYEARVQHLLLDAHGRVLSGPTPVSQTPTLTVGGISAALLPDGRIATAWHDSRHGGLDIIYRLLDENGAPAADEVMITDLSSTQRYPNVVVASDGNVHLFWGDDRDPQPPNSNLYGDELYHQKIAPDGSALGPQQRLTNSNAFVWQPRALVQPDGSIDVVYTSVEIRTRCILFFCFPRAVFEVWHQRIADDGAVLSPAREVSTDENGFSWFPDIAKDPRTGEVVIAYQDDRAGPTALYARRMDATSLAFTSEEMALPPASGGAARPKLAATISDLAITWSRPGGVSVAPISAAGLGMRLDANDSGAYFPRIAAVAGDSIGVVWENAGANFSGLRFARTTADPIGRGLVAIDSTTNVVTMHARDALLTSLATDGSAMLGATSSGVVSADLVSGAEAQSPFLNASFIASDGTTTGYVTRAGEVGLLHDGLPTPLAQIAGGPHGAVVFQGDLYVATTAGIAKMRADTRHILATSAAALAGAGPIDITRDVPGPMGRQLLQAEIVNSAGQVLARADASQHALDGNLVIALTPGVERARVGDAVPLALVVTNRGQTPLRTVNVSVSANGAPVLATTVDLLPGDAASFTTNVVATGAMRLDARAHQPLAGGLDASVHDFVPLAGDVHTRVLGPVAANDAPFDLSLLLANDEDQGRALSVGYAGGAQRVALLPGESRILDYAGIVQNASTRHVFTWNGDATGEAALDVPQSAPPTIALVGPAVLHPGARDITLRIEDPGLLPVDGTLTVARSGATLAQAPIALAPGAKTTERVTLDVAAGEQTLDLTYAGVATRFTLVGSDTPVIDAPAPDSAPLTPGRSIATNVTLRGPDAADLDVVWDLGSQTIRAPLHLEPGQTRTVNVTPDLTSVDAGTYEARLVLEQNGAIVSTTPMRVVVAAPPLHLSVANASLDAYAGTPLAVDALVENAGFTPTSAHVRASLPGFGEAGANPRIQPNENTTVTIRIPIGSDAQDANATLSIVAADASLTIPVRIHGHHATLTASASSASVLEGHTVTITARVHQGDTPQALVLVVENGEVPARLDVPAVADSTLTADIPIMLDTGVGVELQHPNGRVLDKKVLAVSVDRSDTYGIAASLSKTELNAGDTLAVTLKTLAAGNVTVSMGSWFEAAFVLNGTRTISIPIPADLPTGDQQVRWSLDGLVDARGVLVHGVEAEPVGPARIAAGAPGAPLSAEITLSAPSATRGVLLATLSGRDDAVLATSRTLVSVGPGSTQLPLTLAVPSQASGPARLRWSFENASATMGDITLAGGDSRLVLPGTWFDTISPVAVPGAVGATGTLTTTEETATVTITTFLGSARQTFTGAGSHDFTITMPVPENGTYPLVAVATDPAGGSARALLTPFHLDPGDAPVTTLSIAGANATLNGTLVIRPDTTLQVTAIDAGVGVDDFRVRVDGNATPPTSVFTLTPGAHTLEYQAVDRALNAAPLVSIPIIVDADAPIMNVTSPHAGSMVLAGHEVLPILAASPDGAFQVGVAIDGQANVVQGQSQDTDRDGIPDVAEQLLGTDPNDPMSLPSLGATAIPLAPALPTPGSPPAFERPMLVLSGDVHIAYQAKDAVFPTSALTVLLDGAPMLSATDAIDASLSLSGQAVGEHVLTLEASDALGNLAQRSFVLFVLPLSSEGLAATLAQDPRAPSWPLAFEHWLEEDSARIAEDLQVSAAAETVRAQGALAQTQAFTLSLVPPAITGAPDEFQGQATDLVAALQQCPCLSPPVPPPPIG